MVDDDPAPRSEVMDYARTLLGLGGQERPLESVVDTALGFPSGSSSEGTDAGFSPRW
jgi:hypothetical protein